MMTRLTVFLWVALLLTACAAETDNSETNVTYVVVTGQPQAAAFQPTLPPDLSPTNAAPVVPTQTPLPPLPAAAATATPEIPADVTLQIGDRYLLDGRYEDAVFTYRIILDQATGIPPEIQAAAAYGMGQAALREGLFDAAVEAMNILINRFPQDYRAVQAYFLRGDAYLGLSRWQDAIADFQQYLTLRPGVIDSYAYERIADAQVNLGQFQQALQNYELATQSTRNATAQAALMQKVAQLHIANDDPQAAVAQYDGILAFAQNYAYRGSVEFLAARTLVNSGDLSRGLLRMERVVNEYEDTSAAYDALGILLENGMTVDPYLQGRIRFYAEEYQAAIDAFNLYTSQTLLTDIPAQFYLMLGQAYRAIGNADAARVAFQTIIEQFPNDPLFGDALLEQGRTFFLAGDIENAITRYLLVADTYSYLPATAAEALWRAGYLYGTNENPTESRVIFTRLVDTFPDSDQAVSGLTIAASAAIATNETAVAENLYARLATITTGEQQAEAYLQLGRLALQRGDTNLANQSLDQAIAAAPETYYSARARDIRAGVEPFAPPQQILWESDDLTEITEAEAWLRDRFGIVQDGPLWPLSMALEQEPRIVRGRELWAAGAYDEATTEFMAVIDDYSSDALASYQLAIYMRILGAYRPSIFAAANLIIVSGTSTLEVPRYLARLRYPIYHGDEVRTTAEEYGFDPLLLFSLIRHESLFDTNATAAAGEKGLTQVIPNTAAYIAEELNWPDYQHRDLFRPYAGIDFGAFFLAENLNRFDGNVYAGLGAYNAGPGRAIDWLELSGGDPDRFLATITIDSTRLYIQLIYRNYSIYRALYGA